MKYRKLSKSTVQCIISSEDMEEYGLTISDIFARNEKGEGFLRRVIEQAHEEVGYDVEGGNIAMQITPLKNDGLAIIITNDIAGNFNLIEQILRALGGADGFKEALKELGNGQLPMMPEMLQEKLGELQQGNELAYNEEAEQDTIVNDDIRIFEFADLQNLLSFCNVAYGEKQMHSKLFKMSDGYLIVAEKNRLSWKNFNKISALVMEFGTLQPCSPNKYDYIEEHAELLIEKQAIGKLKKIASV